MGAGVGASPVVGPGVEPSGPTSCSALCSCAPRSYLRTMTSLLDPAQMEERERRRLAQQEQQVRGGAGRSTETRSWFSFSLHVLPPQRAIEAQMEERRRQKEQEEAKTRREEEEEEKRVALEREKLQKQYELETRRKKQKVSCNKK